MAPLPAVPNVPGSAPSSGDAAATTNSAAPVAGTSSPESATEPGSGAVPSESAAGSSGTEDAKGGEAPGGAPPRFAEAPSLDPTVPLTDEQERDFMQLAAARYSYRTGMTVAGAVSKFRDDPDSIFEMEPVNDDSPLKFQALCNHLKTKRAAELEAAKAAEGAAAADAGSGGDAGKADDSKKAKGKK